MAQHPSALKRARASKRREVRNTALKTRMKTAVKRVRTATDKEKALVELKKTAKLLDQMAAKGIIHKNKAANNKSVLTKLVNKMQ
ncbi:MAG TPA: 30S ribosomal protein S20 [Bacteroidota bacterium]|jgi:small subunit ribosomal protein S20